MSQIHSVHSDIKISLCMIVKDEAYFIRDFIDRHRNLFDQWVIVDTGSTDGTQQMIRDAGLPLYEFKWTHDFAAARNYALDQCTGDWVAAFDADEFLDLAGQQQMRYFCQKEVDAFELKIKNYISEENLTAHCSDHLVEYIPPNHSYINAFEGLEELPKTDYGYRITQLPRFFRRAAGYRWISPIHEVLTFPGLAKEERLATIDDVYIHHLGMLDLDGKAEKKRDHYRAISQELLSRAGETNDPKLLFESARFIEDFQEKLQLLERARIGAPRDMTILKELANTHLVLNDPGAAIDCCEAMIALAPDTVEPYLARARCRVSTGQSIKGFEELRAHMRQFRQSPMFYYTLASVAVKARRFDDAVSYIDRAFKLAPSSKMIAELHQKLHTAKNHLYK